MAAAGAGGSFWSRPLVKASLTSAVVLAAGDTLAQRLQKQHTSFDWRRAARFGVVGATLHGPYFFAGMRAIDQRFGPSRSLGNALRKTAAAQAVLFPPFVALVFGWVGLLEGKSLQQCAQKIRTAYPETFKLGCCFWPVANTLNFMVVGPQQRVLYVSLASLVWNTFLSQINARSSTLRGESK